MRDTIDMAREAGLLTWLNPPEDVTERFKAFEALVRADEREACAKVADYYSMHDQDTPADIATAIRARSCPPCNEDCDQGRNCPARKDK